MGCVAVTAKLVEKTKPCLESWALEFKLVIRPSFTIFINAANIFYISIIIKVVMIGAFNKFLIINTKLKT